MTGVERSRGTGTGTPGIRRSPAGPPSSSGPGAGGVPARGNQAPPPVQKRMQLFCGRWHSAQTCMANPPPPSNPDSRPSAHGATNPDKCGPSARLPSLSRKTVFYHFFPVNPETASGVYSRGGWFVPPGGSYSHDSFARGMRGTRSGGDLPVSPESAGQPGVRRHGQPGVRRSARGAGQQAVGVLGREHVCGGGVDLAAERR